MLLEFEFELELSEVLPCVVAFGAGGAGFAKVTEAAALMAVCACCSMRVRTGAGNGVVFTRGGTAPVGTRCTRTSIV